MDQMNSITFGICTEPTTGHVGGGALAVMRTGSGADHRLTP